MLLLQLKNGVGKFLKKDGIIELVNGKSGESFRFDRTNEFVLYLGKSKEAVTCDETSFKAPCVINGKDEITLVYSGMGEFDSYIVTVKYSACEETFVKKIYVKRKDGEKFDICRLCAFSGVSSEELSRGGEGQPIFAGNKGWFGTEYPVAINNLVDNGAFCLQAPYENTDCFESLPVVFGLNTTENVQTAFKDYVTKKISPRESYRIYCDWGLHDDEDSKVFLTEKLTLDNIETLCRLKEKTGVKFDYYLMDAFWFNSGETLADKPYGKFKSDTFPNGINNVVNILQEKGMKFGLWFDINFMKAKLVGCEKYDNLLENGSICFACDEVVELMKNAITFHLENHGVKMIKLDFAFFECKNGEHGHSVEFTESKQKSVANYIKMVKEIKEKYPDTVILCYNGWTTNLAWLGCAGYNEGYAISPYWAEYSDYFYCGDPRPSYLSADGMEKSLCYYTDGMIRNFADSLFPIVSIDDHGTMLGETCTIYYLGKKLFRLGWLMNLMRGANKLHLYGDASALDDDDLKYLAYVDKMFAKSLKNDYSCSFIGGDVRKREIYGYSMTNGFSGYAVMINPTPENECATFNLKEFIGSHVRVKTIIKNGEIISGRKRSAYGVYSEEVSAYGYTVIEWEAVSQKSIYKNVNLCASESIVFNVQGKKEFIMEIYQNGKPLRTQLGFPETLTVTADGVELEGQAKKPVWSGLSWVKFHLNGSKKLVVAYGSGKPLNITYTFTE